MKCIAVPVTILFAVLCCVPFAALAGGCREEVMFKQGATTAQVKGQISGDGYCDYLLRAKKGQLLRVKSSSANTAMKLRGPMAETLTDGKPVTLSADGVYTVRVLLPRALARKDQREAYSLDIAITTPEEQAGQAQALPVGRSSKNSVDWPGYYHGLVPCASCPGIDVWLELNGKNNTVSYRLVENYLEEKDAYFQSTGAAGWDQGGQILLLQGDGESRRLFVSQGAAALLAEGENTPANNSAYWLEKLDVFRGDQEMLLVAPSKLSVDRAGKETVVRIKDGVMNFEHSAGGKHRSLRGDLQIFCTARQYTMPVFIYYQQPFAGGKTVDRGGNGEDRLDFAGPGDAVTRAAEQYCR